MAARNRTWTPEIVRNRIRASMLAKRLENHAFGTVEMKNSQVRAAATLLAKCVPDLTRTELRGGDGDSPLTVQVQFVGPA